MGGMSRFLSCLTIVAVLSLTGCAVTVSQPIPTVSTILLKQLKVGGAGLAVEVAATEATREQGLSDRASLPPGQGMLFVFQAPGVYGFWMNRMRFPLDFLWLQQGVVTQVTADVPAPSAAQPDPVRLWPSAPIDAVIEVPAGWAALHQVTAGAKVEGL